MRCSRTAIRVRWGEVDAAGIGYYPNFFSWFVIGTLELLRGGTATYGELFHGESLGLPVIEAHCRFLAPVTYDDELEIETVVAEVRTRAFRLEHRLWRAGEPVAEGYEVRGWQHIDRTRPHEVTLSPIPAAVAHWLRGEDGREA